MKKKFNPALFVLLIPMVAILFALASFYFKRTGISEATQFPYESYIADSTALMGNVYSLHAQIDSQLAFDTEVGRILCVRLEGDNTLAILLPLGVVKAVHPGQKYLFKVEVLQNGAVKVLDLEKF